MVAVVVLTLAVASCGGRLSMADYAEQIEVLVTTMNDRLDGLGEDLGEHPGLEEIKAYASERVDARREFIAGMEALEPPASAADLHEEALEIVGDLTDAEAELASVVAGMTTPMTLDQIWRTPEGIAAQVADVRSIRLCEVAQDSFDQSEAREEFEDVPWVPGEVKHVIRVVLGCNAEDR